MSSLVIVFQLSYATAEIVQNLERFYCIRDSCILQSSVGDLLLFLNIRWPRSACCWHGCPKRINFTLLSQHPHVTADFHSSLSCSDCEVQFSIRPTSMGLWRASCRSHPSSSEMRLWCCSSRCQTYQCHIAVPDMDLSCDLRSSSHDCP